MDRQAMLDQMATMLVAADYTVIPPGVVSDVPTLPSDDASEVEVAAFIVEHSQWLESHAGNIGTLDDDFIRYAKAWLIIISEPALIREMVDKWTSDQIRAHRRDQGKKGAWNLVPDQRYNPILNSALEDVMRERHGERKPPSSSGMDETTGRQRQ